MWVLSRCRVAQGSVALGLAGALALGGCSSGGRSSHPSGSSTAPVTRDAVARTTAAPDWTIYGHDLDNTRLNPHETTINRETVAKLGVVWSKKGLVGVTGTPVVVAGVVYYGDWTGAVWAVKATTGVPIWKTNVGTPFIGSPAVSGDAVFVAGGATLARLDRTKGTLQWKVVTNGNPAAGIDASPVVVDNIVLQATASNEEPIPKKVYTFRGSISAYNARTGKELWRFYTTQNNAHDGPGVGLWSTPAVDTQRKLLFIGSGNAYAEPTGPLADSILAIDYRTG